MELGTAAHGPAAVAKINEEGTESQVLPRLKKDERSHITMENVPRPNRSVRGQSHYGALPIDEKDDTDERQSHAELKFNIIVPWIISTILVLIIFYTGFVSTRSKGNLDEIPTRNFILLQEASPTQGRTLILLRHAKSSWDDPTLEDFDRPLNRRGKRDSLAMGKYLHHHNVRFPDMIYSSPSVRTRMTLKRVQSSWATDSPVQFDQQLFDLALRSYTDLLSTLDWEKRRVMIIGHNPAIEALARELVEGIDKFPTGAYCEVYWDEPNDFEDWSFTLHIKGELVSFVKPENIH